MPTYDYQCRSCGTITEVVHSMTEDGPTACPVCGGSLRRVIHPTGIIFKGSGFYKTDSRQARAGSSSTASAGSAPTSGAAGAAGDTSAPGERSATGEKSATGGTAPTTITGDTSRTGAVSSGERGGDRPSKGGSSPSDRSGS